MLTGAPSARRLADALKDDTITGRLLWLLAFVPVALAYLASGHWAMNNADGVAAAWPGWALVHVGTLHLEHLRSLPLDPWFIAGAHGHVVASRMPGVVFIGVPMQALFAWTGWSPMAPSVITASLVTAAAVGNVTLLLRKMSTATCALTAGMLLGFGTPLWTVAGVELWTHGPDVLWLSAGLLALANRRCLLAGLLFAPAILTRPHLAIALAVIGVVVARSRRSFRVLPQLGVPAALAILGVMAYNAYLYGRASIAGGTYSYATHSALSGGGGSSDWLGLHWWATNTAGLLFSPMRGLLPYAPIVLLAAVALRPAWRTLPDWGKAGALGGVAYLLLQARINTFEGGYDYYGSRLTIETMLLSAPLGFASGRLLWERGHRGLVATLSAASVGIELIGAAFGRVITVPWTYSPWRTWLPAEVLRSAGPKAVPVMVMTALLVVLVAVKVRQRASGAVAHGQTHAAPSAQEPVLSAAVR